MDGRRARGRDGEAELKGQISHKECMRLEGDAPKRGVKIICDGCGGYTDLENLGLSKPLVVRVRSLDGKNWVSSMPASDAIEGASSLISILAAELFSLRDHRDRREHKQKTKPRK